VFESEAVLNAFLLNYLRQSLADLPEEKLDEVPIADLHSLRWILTHLAIVADMGLVLLGKAKECPGAWHAAYGPKSTGRTHEKIRPTRIELTEKIDSLYPKVVEAAKSASAELLDQQHPLELLRSTTIQTNRHLMAHLLTTHFAIHLGQLSAIRRQMGFPHLF
jgi:uncharacterized damage-inducible protein DinB